MLFTPHAFVDLSRRPTQSGIRNLTTTPPFTPHHTFILRNSESNIPPRHKVSLIDSHSPAPRTLHIRNLKHQVRPSIRPPGYTSPPTYIPHSSLDLSCLLISLSNDCYTYPIDFKPIDWKFSAPCCVVPSSTFPLPRSPPEHSLKQSSMTLSLA